MPQFIRAAGYKIYFWSNEKGEPIHFHATKGDPDENDTKVWVLQNGSFKVAHNKGRISEKDLSLSRGFLFSSQPKSGKFQLTK